MDSWILVSVEGRQIFEPIPCRYRGMETQLYNLFTSRGVCNSIILPIYITECEPIPGNPYLNCEGHV